MNRCDICEGIHCVKERSSSSECIALANSLREKHIQRYTGARIEIERLIGLSIQEPKRMLTISTDGMDNKKVIGTQHIIITTIIGGCLDWTPLGFGGGFGFFTFPGGWAIVAQNYKFYYTRTKFFQTLRHYLNVY